MDDYMLQVEECLSDPGAICAYHMGEFDQLISEHYSTGRTVEATAQEIEERFM